MPRNLGFSITFALFVCLVAASTVAAEESPAGTWKSTGDYGFLLQVKTDGTGTHYDLDYATGKLSNSQAVKWRVDPTTKDPIVFTLENGRLDRKGCRMHLNPNGNLSIRGNTEGEVWVLVPEKK